LDVRIPIHESEMDERWGRLISRVWQTIEINTNRIVEKKRKANTEGGE
jgi:hypothetical protein